MKDINTIKSAITNNIQERMKECHFFETFTQQLTDLGIERFTFDAITNEMSFYVEDKFVCSLLRKDIQEESDKNSWALGKEFDNKRIETAIQDLDSGKINGLEFHREFLSAGVVFCQVYLNHKKIYYFGFDAQFYLEQY